MHNGQASQRVWWICHWQSAGQLTTLHDRARCMLAPYSAQRERKLLVYQRFCTTVLSSTLGLLLRGEEEFVSPRIETSPLGGRRLSRRIPMAALPL